MEGTYQINKETGKVEIHFAKKDYDALSVETKGEIKSRFLWSGSAGCWVSRSKHNHYWAIQIALRLGLTDAGTVGERLSYGEQLAQQQERAEARADRMEGYAHNAEQRSDSAWKASNAAVAGIEPGQPVLVGHHSEGRHRAALARCASAMDRMVEESKKSEYFQQRAAAARATAGQAQLQSPVYLTNRIMQYQAELRDIGRKVDQYKDNPKMLQWLEELADRAEEARDKLAFFQDALAALGGVAYSKETVRPGDYVMIRGRCHKVVRANAKTVSVATEYSWTNTYPYAEIKEHRTAAQAAESDPRL